MIKSDRTTIARDGLLRIDGHTIGRLVIEGDKVFIQSKDRKRARNLRRGSQFVYIELGQLVQEAAKHFKIPADKITNKG